MIKNRGVLLLTVLLLSGVLLIFVASYLTSSARNADMVAMCSEKEEAMNAANAGLQAASAYVACKLKDSSIDNFLNGEYDSGWIRLESDKDSYKNLDLFKRQKPEYRFHINYATRTIDAQGRVMALSKNGKDGDSPYVLRHLRTLFFPEFLGVGAERIRANEKEDSISSIYSYQTYIPLDAWILLGHGYKNDICPRTRIDFDL